MWTALAFEIEKTRGNELTKHSISISPFNEQLAKAIADSPYVKITTDISADLIDGIILHVPKNMIFSCTRSFAENTGIQQDGKLGPNLAVQ